MLMRLWFFFREKYGNFKLEDSVSFYKNFDKAMLRFTSREEKNLLKEEIKDGKDVRLIHEAFKGYLTVHTSKRKAIDSCKWLTEKAKFDPLKDGSISALDTKRFFSNAEIAEKLAEQDYKCWITGKELTMKKAQGAHIVPYSKGGRTEWNNLIVVEDVHNRKMGDMNAYDYKDMYDRKAA
jgi:5-methylcytosine-specific restriction endonuclease McrA